MGSLEATLGVVFRFLMNVYIALGFAVLVWFAIRQYTRTNTGGRGTFTPMLGSKRNHEMTKSRQSDIQKFKAKSRDEQIEEFLTKKQIRKIKEKHKKDN